MSRSSAAMMRTTTMYFFFVEFDFLVHFAINIHLCSRWWMDSTVRKFLFAAFLSLSFSGACSLLSSLLFQLFKLVWIIFCVVPLLCHQYHLVFINKHFIDVRDVCMTLIKWLIAFLMWWKANFILYEKRASHHEKWFILLYSIWLASCADWMGNFEVSLCRERREKLKQKRTTTNNTCQTDLWQNAVLSECQNNAHMCFWCFYMRKIHLIFRLYQVFFFIWLLWNGLLQYGLIGSVENNFWFAICFSFHFWNGIGFVSIQFRSSIPFAIKPFRKS